MPRFRAASSDARGGIPPPPRRPFRAKETSFVLYFQRPKRKEERTTWESIAQNRPHMRRRAVSVQDEAVEVCARHVPRAAYRARTGTGTKWRREAFRASDVAARMCTPPRGGLCGLRNPKWYPPNEVSREAGAMRGASRSAQASRHNHFVRSDSTVANRTQPPKPNSPVM